MPSVRLPMLMPRSLRRKPCAMALSPSWILSDASCRSLRASNASNYESHLAVLMGLKPEQQEVVMAFTRRMSLSNVSVSPPPPPLLPPGISR